MKDSMATKKDPLEFFGADPEEIEIGSNRRSNQNREVCICGHPMSHHETIYEGMDTCQESKMYCPCKYKKAVLEVDDLRAFKFSTEGFGRDHALWKGLKKLRKMGKQATTLVDSTCWRCFQEAPIEPVPLTQENRVSRYAQARNVMLCTRCRFVLDGIDPSFLVDEVELAPGEAVSAVGGPGVSEENLARGEENPPSWPDVFVRQDAQSSDTNADSAVVKLSEPPY